MQSLPSLQLKLGPVCYAPSPNITAKFCWHLGTCSRLVWFLVGSVVILHGPNGEIDIEAIHQSAMVRLTLRCD